MLGVEGIASDRRMRRRIAVMVAHRPSDRRQALLFKSAADLEALRQLTSAEREAADAHLARVITEQAGR